MGAFRSEWKEQYVGRDLVAVSTYPLLVEPTHYTGQPGYFTDTEHSQVINLSNIPVKGDTSSIEEYEAQINKGSMHIHTTEL